MPTFQTFEDKVINIHSGIFGMKKINRIKSLFKKVK